MSRTVFTLEITIDGHFDPTLDAVERVLDAGTFQDAIVEYAGDEGHSLEVISALLAKKHRICPHDTSGGPASCQGPDELGACDDCRTEAERELRIQRGEFCSPTCCGWFVADDGVITACEACGLYEDNDEAADVVMALLEAHGHDSLQTGWGIFESDERGFEIEADDEAELFDNDDDAITIAVARLSKLASADVGPRHRPRTTGLAKAEAE